MHDIFIYVVAMPCNVREMAVPCCDGYTIYINANLSQTEQLRAYHHALAHIKRNDWEQTDIQQIEMEAHLETP